MSYVTGEVVPTPNSSKPYTVIFKHSDGDETISECGCDSIEEGEALIVQLLSSLRKEADR